MANVAAGLAREGLGNDLRAFLRDQLDGDA
jgi:hypothetical protein